ncbi:carbonic anhydrase [Plastoroseomonas arctica]|uniref:carbonic anhydrase n=1 Tax=Plastoroseomonas arctica TaxID=1509237 RepID=A0AAF1K431_9PROT|nr:carbonic anhydrase [Plastoroseomonas arctica]MBR0655854.1 carbonic anhydrase [Plastoroseomonas arctica]
MNRLLDGYRRFRAETWSSARAHYEALTLGQNPATMVIACSDSRVDPQTVFGAAPGELFVVRNIAAQVPPYAPDGGCHGTSAALEYGVRVLKVRRIVVLGHALCGGVRGIVEGVPPEASDFVGPWVGMAHSILECIPVGLSGEATLTWGEEAAVRLSLANLMTFPWIAGPVASGELELAGFRFGIHDGVLSELRGAAFVPVS